MKNLTVRPEPIPQRRGYPERGHQHTPPPPPERPFAINIVQQPEQNQMQLKDVVRFAGESFSAMKAMQDEYGRSIPATYAERDTVDDLKEEVRTLSDKERDFSLTGDVEGSVKINGKNDAAITVKVKTSAQAVSDGEGNEISKTYARADELENYVKRDEISAKVDELERAAISGAKMVTSDCLKASDLQFATDSDILKIFRWGRA